MDWDDNDLFKGRRSYSQGMLLPTDCRDLCDRLGLSWTRACLLYERGFLSFDPAEHCELRSDGMIQELSFLGTLVAAGCDESLLRILLRDLIPPYGYDITSMAFDWSRLVWVRKPDPALDRDNLIELAVELGNPELLRVLAPSLDDEYLDEDQRNAFLEAFIQREGATFSRACDMMEELGIGDLNDPTALVRLAADDDEGWLKIHPDHLKYACWQEMDPAWLRERLESMMRATDLRGVRAFVHDDPSFWAHMGGRPALIKDHLIVAWLEHAAHHAIPDPDERLEWLTTKILPHLDSLDEEFHGEMEGILWDCLIDLPLLPLARLIHLLDLIQRLSTDKVSEEGHQGLTRDLLDRIESAVQRFKDDPSLMEPGLVEPGPEDEDEDDEDDEGDEDDEQDEDEDDEDEDDEDEDDEDDEDDEGNEDEGPHLDDLPWPLWDDPLEDFPATDVIDVQKSCHCLVWRWSDLDDHDYYRIEKSLVDALQALSLAGKTLRERAFTVFIGDAGYGSPLLVLALGTTNGQVVKFIHDRLYLPRLPDESNLSSLGLPAKYRYDHGHLIEYCDLDEELTGTRYWRASSHGGVVIYRRAVIGDSSLLGLKSGKTLYGKLIEPD